MRTEHKLTVFTLADGSTITTRSALETRWAIFFNELGLKWKYEPCRIDGYLPDFEVEGLGFVEIKPTLALLISESTKRIEKAAHSYPKDKIYAFCGERVSLDIVAMYHGKSILAPTWEQMIHVIYEALQADTFSYVAHHIEIARERANRSKLDHFVSVSKILELGTIPELKAERQPMNTNQLPGIETPATKSETLPARQAQIINTYHQLKAAVAAGLIDKTKAVAVSYEPRPSGRMGAAQCNKSQVYSPFFKTDPDSAWYNYGNKTFTGNRSKSFPQAKSWASETYGIADWKPNAMRAHIPSIVQQHFPIRRSSACLEK